jgi:hypothetical protein
MRSRLPTGALFVDFNYLYLRQQVSLMRADLASCGPSRAAHEGLAQLYSGMIERRKAERAADRQSEVIIDGRRDIISAAGV